MAETDYLMELVGPDAIDLGGGHWARLFIDGDDPGSRTYVSPSDAPAAGFFHVHPSKGQNHVPEGEPCAGSVTFGKWQLISLDPLHVEPSILCSCGRHGYVRDGKWVEA